MIQGIFNPYDNTEVEYTFLPGEPTTWDDPGCPPEIEFGPIKINDKPAGKDLEEDLFDAFGDDWEEKILENIAKAKANYEAERGDYLYDQRRDRDLERALERGGA